MGAHAERLHGLPATITVIALVVVAVCKAVITINVIRKYRRRRKP